MSLAGGKALPGTCAPPRKSRGTGPVGYKFPKGTQETMGGAGTERSVVEFPGSAFPPAGLTTEHKTEVAPFLMRPLLTM